MPSKFLWRLGQNTALSGLQRFVVRFYRIARGESQKTDRFVVRVERLDGKRVVWQAGARAAVGASGHDAARRVLR